MQMQNTKARSSTRSSAFRRGVIPVLAALFVTGGAFGGGQEARASLRQESLIKGNLLTKDRPFTIVITDADLLDEPPAEETLRWGIGVYPSAVNVQEFGRVFWSGARASDGIAGTLGGNGLSDLLGSGRARLTLEPGAPPRAVAFAMGMNVTSAPMAMVDVVVTSRPWELLRERLTVFVIGVTDQLPVLVVTRGTSPPGNALLDPVGPGHPGVLAPFDLTVSVAAVIGLDVPDGYPGQQLRTVVVANPREAVDALAARFRRDTRWPFPVALTMILLLLAAAFIGGFAARLVLTTGPNAARLGHRLASVAAVTLLVVPFGYVVALMLPVASSAARAVPILVLAVVGGVFAFRAERRTAAIAVGRLGVLLVVTVLGLTVVSALRPGLEPALSFWDSPLVSFRVSGLRNSLAAFTIGGFLVAFATKRLAGRWVLLVAVLVTVIFGAPWLGSNIIAVLSFVTGAATAFDVSRHGRLTFRGAIGAAVLGTGATAIAFALDAAGATHAGRLLDATEVRGAGLVGRILTSRVETNLGRVAEVGPIGWVGLVGLTILMGLLFHDAIRGHQRAGTLRLVSRLDTMTRAGIAGIVTAALISLVLEDTGFLTAGTIAPFAVGLVAAATAATLPKPDGDLGPGRAVQR